MENKGYSSWATIPWFQVESRVAKYQQRIYRAEIDGLVRKRKKLQRRLILSKDAKFLAVRQVTEGIKGRRTAGVDKMAIVSNKEKHKLASTLALEIEKSKAQPIRRVFIPKPGKDVKCPLGIPTIRDRAQQCLVKYAIEPQWEATFEPNSYGFRPGRRCQDAIAGLYLSLRHGDRFILNADIQKCFDKINHEKLLDKLNTSPIIRDHIKLWLKADIMEGYMNRPKGPMAESIVGTPQGGVISALLANIALHGLETATKSHYANVVYSGVKTVAKRDRERQCGIIRYADDFVVSARTEEEILQLQEFISKWLQEETGLKLSPEKTTVKRSSQGFDFLGFHLIYLLTDKGRRPKLKIHVSKTSKKWIVANTRAVFQSNKSVSAPRLIQLLNPKIVGWCNYFRYTECTRDFKAVEYVIFGQLRAWVFRRRSKGLRSRTDIKNKYFPGNLTVMFNGVKHTGEWILIGEISGRQGIKRTVFLAYPSWVRSRNYIKVKGTASPFDANHVYWTTRMGKYSGWSTTKSQLFKAQEGKCPLCTHSFTECQYLEIDHILALADGGTDTKCNRHLVHRYCHQRKTSREASVRSKKVQKSSKNCKLFSREPDEVKVSRPVLNTSVDL